VVEYLGEKQKMCRLTGAPFIAKRLRASVFLVTLTGKSGKFFPKQGSRIHSLLKISPLSIECLIAFGRIRRGTVNALLGESGPGGLRVETVY
jgi:hypothetical protein